MRAVLGCVLGDITQTPVDAIVNAANSGLLGGGGADGAIHRAGGPEILAECRRIVARIGRLEPGLAVATSAGRLPCKFVIHTVGPEWNGGDQGEGATLSSAYRTSLHTADGLGCTSIAFPAISTGAFGFPRAEATGIAVAAVRSELPSCRNITRVLFVCRDAELLGIYRTRIGTG